MITKLLIIGGIVLFLVGIFVLAYEIYLGSNFKLGVETELMILFGMVSLGLIIAGVGVMIEFSKKKWSMTK